MDANKVEAAITPQTKCILPVHLGGSPPNMDKILEVARKHHLPVLEDACQAHLAEWRHQKVGTVGDLGCFSFQASKNLNCGEGGAILSNNKELIERCVSFANHGSPVRPAGLEAAPTIGEGAEFVISGTNCRITEFQGALLLAQAARVEAQSRTRTENATYLTKLLSQIPGITPARMYDGCTRNAYHLYMLRYDKEHFSGLSRARFLKSLRAEGIPCADGYRPLNKEPVIEAMLNSRAFKKIYTEQELAYYRERNQCPENDKLCEEAVWMFQTMFLGTRADMDQIAEAIRKVQTHAAELARS
jgi:dTDP-4-amino-4,6-dideoxygalactose transaminase